MVTHKLKHEKNTKPFGSDRNLTSVSNADSAGFYCGANAPVQSSALGYTMNVQKASSNRDIVIQRKLDGQWFRQLSQEEQQTLLHLEQNTNRAQLETGQIGAFSAYVGGSYEYYNMYLREVYNLSPDEKDEKLDGMKRYSPNKKAGSLNKINDEKAIESLQAAYQNAPIIESAITVYRGCGRYLQSDETRSNLLEGNPAGRELLGKIFVEPGFLSTSARRSYAEGFAGKGGVLLTLHIPAGAKAFYVTERLERRPSGTKLRDEDEIIFPPNRKMQITSVTRSKRSGMLHYEISANLLDG
ncbi:MAG: ADP-ribosyltransferase [Lachnospiraceae bacterium]|nr:ADP-ribosyltransferase [Lachnospiraceae bacterium]